ncbi:MAG: valyl-tRNA synthetase [Acidimicrobiales bacterium]|nr:valyl-tRNA synthetase [Acidimicrobiales bacterium]
MLEPFRLVTIPVPALGPLPGPMLSALVSVDAVLRRARAEGRRVEWAAAILTGGLADQLAVERELLREGVERDDVGREGFRERVRAFNAEARAAIEDQLAALGVAPPDQWLTTDDDTWVRASRTAFVRLYDEGLLTRAERVVCECPSCRTVVDDAGIDRSSLPAERVEVRMPRDEELPLAVAMVALELLPGVVAIAVPEGHEAARSTVVVPIVDRTVPVIEDAEVDAPRALVPAHDPEDHEVALRHGLTPVEVLDDNAIVRAPGPLDGISRFAARAAARELLAAEGVLGAVEDVDEPTGRCGRCGTVLIPRLGRHWFLASAGLEGAAADAVREGQVGFSPSAARERLIERAGAVAEWCLSHQVWAGLPVPVARCLDCGQLSIDVEPEPSCGKCMGTLEAEDDVLDNRFAGTLWPLVAAGWPDDRTAAVDLGPTTTFLVGPDGVGDWVLPVLALGLRLAGGLSIGSVLVYDLPPEAETLPIEVDALLADEGTRITRVLLAAAGAFDVDAARAFVALVDSPPEGASDGSAVLEALDAHYAAGTPGAALPAVAAALAEGLLPGAAARVQAAVAPIIGD